MLPQTQPPSFLQNCAGLFLFEHAWWRVIGMSRYHFLTSDTNTAALAVSTDISPILCFTLEQIIKYMEALCS